MTTSTDDSSKTFEFLPCRESMNRLLSIETRSDEQHSRNGSADE